MKTENRGWQHFSHGADLGICGWGPSHDAAFEEAATALTAAVTRAEVVPAMRVDVSCEARALDLLFVAWINAVIYEMAVRQMLFGRFAVRIAGYSLSASMWGEAVDRGRHEPACEPKGATYTELAVSRDAKGRCTARCVVDV